MGEVQLTKFFSQGILGFFSGLKSISEESNRPILYCYTILPLISVNLISDCAHFGKFNLRLCVQVYVGSENFLL